MTDRVFMGNHPSFGTGFYISKPGSNVLAPNTNLLLDSRYRQMRILTRGIASMSSFSASDYSLWYTTVTFTDLGYVPLFWAAIIYQSDNYANIPVNSSAYPAPDCGESDGTSITFASTWLEGNNVLKAKARAGFGGGSGNMSMNYIIFSNPQDSG